MLAALQYKEPDAEARLIKEYEAAGKPYYQEIREYYSSGTVTFNVVPTDPSPIILAGQFPRYVMMAPAQQRPAILFGYKIGDPMGIANSFTTNGTAQLIATKDDTNILEAGKTNTEDFAASAIGFQIKRLRIEGGAGTDFPFAAGAANDGIRGVLLNGTAQLQDPGSHVVPPEIQSPLMLQDTLGRAVMKGLNLREVWDNRAEDDIALARGLGPLGAESYLNAQGEPTAYNGKRLDPGILWRRQNQDTDTRFNIEAALHSDIWTIVSWPQALVAAGDIYGTLTKIHVDYQVILAGKAFYYPSKNAG